MKNDLTCEVVQDLLPSYADGLTSAVTNTAIESHIKTCDSCRQIRDDMLAPEPALPETDADASTIDFLKKNRRKNRNRILAAVVAACLLISGIWGFRTCILPVTLTDASQMHYSVTVTDSKTVAIEGSLNDDSLGVCALDYTVDPKDPQTVSITVKANRLSASKHNTFSDRMTASQEVKKVYVNDQIAWEDGTAILPKTAQIYATIHPYVGSITDNGKTLAALGINDVLPITSHELQTTDEPYGWTMHIDGTFSKDQQAKLEQLMKGYAMVLLVCTENLGSVTFSYSLDGTQTDFTYTKEQGEHDFHGTCAFFRSYASEFQVLLAKSGILNAAFSILPQKNGYRLTQAVRKVSDAQITGSIRAEKETIRAQYENYQPTDSHAPGTCDKRFSSQKAALAYIGYDKLKPFPLPQKPTQIEVTTLGDQSGNICYVSLLEQYTCANAITVSACVDFYTEYSTISNYVSMDFPSTEYSPDAVSSAEDYTTPSGDIWEIVTTVNGTDAFYDSMDAYLTDGCLLYRIGVSYPANQVKTARTTLLQILDQMAASEN